jgi:glycerol-3-phosphate dehydrogenase
MENKILDNKISSAASRTPLPEGPFDLAIIGGGIHGAAIARDAVLRGLTVCLVEKEDFAFGASGRSSKMLHGGVQHLEQLQLGLVLECLRERSLQLKLAPHLTTPRTFVIPVYQEDRRGVTWIRLGLFLYDILALGRRLGKARPLQPAEVLERVPGLRPEGLVGGGLYLDGVMDDTRICLANLLDAREAAKPGQFHYRNYAHALEWKPTSPIRLQVEDRILQKSSPVLAHRVVRAIGPWTDENFRGAPLHCLSKGVQLLLPLMESSVAGPHALVLSHSREKRVFFVIPWKGKSLVGTIGTPFQGSPDEVRVEPGEVDYLLSELRRLFPGRTFHHRDILATFASVRPLAKSRFQWRSPGRFSRHHRIVDSGHGVLTLVGGKFTNYRAIAQDVMNRILPGSGTRTHRRPLHGGEEGNWEAYLKRVGGSWVERFGEPAVRRLFSRYGSRLAEVLQLIEADSSLMEPIASPYPEIRAEVVHAVLRESVHYPADFICRRTDMRYEAGNGRGAYDEVEHLIRKYGDPLKAAPPDLSRARERFLEELQWEDQLRKGVTMMSPK